MAFTSLNNNLNIVQGLGDRPNALDGLSAAQLKAKFDEASNLIKTYINTVLITELAAVTDGDSGADNIGATGITDLDGATVQAILESFRNKLKATTSGSSGADFIGAGTISGLAGDTVQELLEALKTYIDLKDTDIGNNYVSKTELTTTRKLDASANFTGSWHGISNPALADPGISGVVEQHTAQLVDIGLNVKNFGAHLITEVGYSTFDSTASIQSALDAGSFVIVPPGDYLVNGTIIINSSKQLHVMKGATLWRKSAQSASTEPIIRLGGNFSLLTGEGTIQTENASPKGILRVGSPDTGTTLAACGWPEIHDVTLWGIKANGNIGLHMVSSEPYSGGSLYNGKFNNLKIRFVGTGVKKEKWVNAHTFNGTSFYEIGQYCFHDVETIENIHFGGFTHFSADVTVIKQTSCNYNEFYGVLAEPGGLAKYYDIDVTSLNIHIFGNGNCAGVAINNSATSAILNFSSLTVKDMTVKDADITGRLNQGMYGVRKEKTNIATAATAVIDITVNSAYKSAYAKVCLTAYFASSSNLQAHYIYNVLSSESTNAEGGGSAILELQNQSVGNFTVAASNFVVTRPSAGVIRITYTNTGVGANGLEVFVEGFGISSVTIA